MPKIRSDRNQSINNGNPECDRCDHFSCTKAKDCFRIRPFTIDRYRDGSEELHLAGAAARVEAEHYSSATRIEEIALFAEGIGSTRVGVAFCVGFKKEAREFCDLMRRRFEVISVCCKNGAVPKTKYQMPHIRPVKRENICNPMGQAELLNRAGTDLNIAMGLCVGHDSLFFKNSIAPVTVLAVKDRVLAHNPMGALYCPYHLRKLREGTFASRSRTAPRSKT